jgi:zinc/manganese transport system substrate-binding protein
MRIVPSISAAVAASSLLLLSACGGSDDAAAPGAAGSSAPASASGGVSVVTSTNVYGDIVSAIAGDDVEVTSVISDPSADPHSYEADTRTQLAVSDADLVIANGGGYDDFMDTLLSASDSKAQVIDVVELSGREAEAEAAGEELNEHVWYDFETVLKLSDEVVSSLSEIDPDHASDYEANGKAFSEKVQGLIDSEAEKEPGSTGAGVAITEPVPGYLLDALGAENRTPEEFSEAIEEGGDVAPAVLQQTVDLFSGGQVKALVYNEQTTGPETEQVLSAAEAAGVAVVPVTETLPEGEDYVSWMQSNIDAVSAALSS